MIQGHVNIERDINTGRTDALLLRLCGQRCHSLQFFWAGMPLSTISRAEIVLFLFSLFAQMPFSHSYPRQKSHSFQ
jgi:hypothetical protein